MILRTSGRGRRPDGDEWLLFHKRDGWAVDGWDPEDHPESVLSARTNVDVAEGRPGRWPAATTSELAALDAIGDKGRWSVAGVETQLTNLDKVMMPGRDGGPTVTKRDLVRYYTTVAPWLSASLSGRPINLNRFPDGIDAAKGGFYHKAVPTHAPEFIRRWPNPLAESDRTREYLLIDGAPSLAWVANYAGFEIHPWTSTAATPEQPTYALVDIDPGTTTSWDDTLTMARLFRVAMERLGLVARPKVTGKRGIQIWIPVQSGYTFKETSAFVERLSKTVGGRRARARELEMAEGPPRRQGPPRLHPERDQQDARGPLQRPSGTWRAGVGAARVGRARRPRPAPGPVDDP